MEENENCLILPPLQKQRQSWMLKWDMLTATLYVNWQGIRQTSNVTSFTKNFCNHFTCFHRIGPSSEACIIKLDYLHAHLIILPSEDGPVGPKHVSLQSWMLFLMVFLLLNRV